MIDARRARALPNLRLVGETVTSSAVRVLVRNRFHMRGQKRSRLARVRARVTGLA